MYVLLLLALLCSLQPSPLCEAAVYYVKPMQPHNATCPSDHPCLTLDEYAGSPKRYFTSNSVFLFLSGNHELSSSFNVSGIHDLTLKPYIVGDSVYIYPLMSYPYIPVTLGFKRVTHGYLVDIAFASIWLVFENSSDITLAGVSAIDAPCAPYSHVAIRSKRSTMFFVDINFQKLHDSCIISVESDITISGHSTFTKCNATVIALHGNSNMLFRGNTIFTGTYNSLGGTITLRDRSTVTNHGNLTFSQNNGLEGGAILGLGNSVIHLVGKEIFVDNGAIVGGALALREHSQAVINGSVLFYKNSNPSLGSGGALVVRNSGVLFLSGTVVFVENSAHIGGGAILLSGSGRLVIDGDITFVNNIAYQGGAIASVDNTELFLRGNVTFIGNSAAANGGAMAMMGNHRIWLKDPDRTLITFSNNHATDYGGALYFSPQFIINEPECTLLLEYCPEETLFIFTNNVASKGGDAIYGAFLDWITGCTTPSGSLLTNQSSIVSNFSHFSPSFSNEPSLISSYPYNLCFCDEGGIDCSSPPPHYSVYPGELFHVYAAVVGDMQGLVTYALEVSLKIQPGTAANMGHLQQLQSSNCRYCTNFTFSVFTNASYFLLVFKPDMYLRSVSLVLSVLSCPIGFSLSSKAMFCDCVQKLQDLDSVSCNITEKAIHRQGTIWIGALKDDSSSQFSVAFSTWCPFYYCNNEEVNISINQTHLDQDAQCNNDRSGILCGGCKANYSLALGSNKCLPGCNNNSLALAIAFAAAGIALVFFIKVFNLTVSRGTLNGLIFYANIIGAQPTLFFPTGVSPAFNLLYVFIAWLNLDLGIETCMCNGMAANTKAWLEFVFPVYVWVIALFIIVISHYSVHASRLFGNNSVPMLATLIIISYAKLLRAVICPLAFTHIHFLNGTKIAVWKQDGNLYYLTGNHIPLFISALAVLVLLLVPFTAIMISIQWLNRGTHYRVLCWVTKLKPFFDAFTGPLKDKHCYWVGVLLLIRWVLLLIILTFASDGKSIALLSVILVVFLILTVTGSMYKSRCLAILEQSYFLNLGFFAAGTLYVQLVVYENVHGNQEALVITSVGTALLQFVATVIVHALVQIRKPLNKIKSQLLQKMKLTENPILQTIDAEPDVWSSTNHDNSGFRESIFAFMSDC